jgi:hypothetical protein
LGTICAVTRGLNRFETISVALAVIIAAAAGALALASAANTAVFLVSAAALVALAWIVGVATEQLGASAGPKVGGVLNATFGNAAELIITIFAIRAGQLEVATASITGSILGNTLLVLGASFFIGGLKNGLQSFNQRVAGMNASMLALAVIGLGIPTLFGHVAERANVSIATVSRTINHVPTVNAKMAKRVWEVIRELNYFPNTQARALVSGRTRLLGLIVSEITNPFFPAVVRGEFCVTQHLMFECVVRLGDDEQVYLGLNEIVIHADPGSHMLDLELQVRLGLSRQSHGECAPQARAGARGSIRRGGSPR